MDKSQRQLIDTYFRKRRIAAKENSVYNLESFELIYSLENNILSVNDLKDNEISRCLIKRPDLFEKINSEKDLNEMDFYYIKEIMISRPELIELFDFKKIIEYHNFSAWNSGEQLVQLLVAYPELINKFPKNIFSNSMVKDLITNQPKLLNIFINRIESERWNANSIVDILNTFPKLKDRFKYAYLSPDDRLYLLYYKPQLVDKLFKFYGKDHMDKIKSAKTSGLIYTKLRKTFPDLIEKHPELKPYFEN